MTHRLDASLLFAATHRLDASLLFAATHRLDASSSRRFIGSTTLRGDSSTGRLIDRMLFAATHRLDDSSARRLFAATHRLDDSSARRLFAATHRLDDSSRRLIDRRLARRTLRRPYAADFACGIYARQTYIMRRFFLADCLVDGTWNVVSCDAMDPRYTQHVSSTYVAVLWRSSTHFYSGLSANFL